MQIHRVDADDDAAIKALARIAAESSRFENPYSTSYTAEELREELRGHDSSVISEGYLAAVDDRPVAAALLELFMTDNTDKAWFTVDVVPQERRRGYGSQLLSFAERRAIEQGRTTLMTSAQYPHDADDFHPYRRFLTSRGYAFSQAEVHRILDLPADAARLRRLLHDAEPHVATGGYTFAQFDGELPDHLLGGYCVLLNTMLTDAPRGEVEFEAGGLTPDHLRQRWALWRRQGRTAYTCVALAPDGVPVAHSQLLVPEHDPGKVFQWDTLVHRDHRGHRLGVSAKVHNLLTVQRAHPDRTRVHTWNAESNRPMITVNEAMGFVPVGCIGAYYRTPPTG